MLGMLLMKRNCWGQRIGCWLAAGAVVLGMGLGCGAAVAVERKVWELPLAGNAYLTSEPTGAPDRVSPSGIGPWQSEKSVFSVFFRADREATLRLSLRMRSAEGESVIRVKTAGEIFQKEVEGADFQVIDLGSVAVKSASYVRVDVQGVRREGASFGEVSDMLVESEDAGLQLDFVKEGGGNRFYWGRRGPSVHLPYEVPPGKDLEFFYSEVTVPKGMDPIGSYFMANGFGEGYFGMQVNGAAERRILFSVWSPFQTDDPDAIPEAERVEMLAKGKEVRAGEFGNEGAGGQSFLQYPWKAGTTYSFLNRARPDGLGSTIYTAWFLIPETGKWSLIASFRRPKTSKHLTGIHSFLENFEDRDGYRGRMAYYGNQWARDRDGKWHELTRAKLTGDDIAQRGYRLDYAGGADKGRFFMRNGGFFADSVKLGTAFERQTTRVYRPKIDLDALEAIK